MAEQDGRRRLTLVRKVEEVAPFAERVRPPVLTIGVAHVLPGALSLAWPAELAIVLGLRRATTLAVLSFAGEPVVDAALRERLAAANVGVLTHHVIPRENGLTLLFEQIASAPGPSALCLCVGEPAVALLEPWIDVLLGTDAAPSRWLPSLRPRASLATLELPTPRLSLARAIGSALPLP
jgi:hypothetical protein